MTVLARHTAQYRSFAPLGWLTRALAVRRQREALAALDDRALRDLGIDRQTAWNEANRPFWDLPC